MSQLPELKKDHLTIAELAKRWTKVFAENVSEDMVLEYGKCGNLVFEIIDEKCKLPTEYNRIQILYPTDGTTPYKNQKITRDQLKSILGTHRILQIMDLFGNIDGFEEDVLYSARFRYVARDSLFVSMVEVRRFEGIGNEESKLSKTEKPLTSKDLFTCQARSRKFDEVVDAVDKFIEEHQRLPMGLSELWDYLKQHYEVEMHDIKLPSGKFTEDNFRRCYKRWTKIQ